MALESPEEPMPDAGRIPAPLEANTEPGRDRADAALELMVEALRLIDANDGPADAGCYLDHAIHRLREWIDRRGT
jgi:hypothetical protein